MNYEEKYENLIEKLKNAKEEHGGYTFSSVIDKIVPELHESEDERVRKSLIALVRQSSEVLSKQNQESMIAWLEKQGEKSLSTEETELNSLAFLTELGYTCIPPKEEKLSEWSEDDEGKLNSTIFLLKEFREAYQENAESCINWLKSLKPQLKQEWNEEEDMAIRTAMSACKYMAEHSKEDSIDYKKAFDILFSLKPQPKKEWSKEDSKRLDRIHQFMLANRKGDTDEIYQQEQDADWLMTLKPYTKQEWSEEDEKTIDEAISLINMLASGYEERVTEPITLNGVKMINDIKERLRNLHQKTNHWKPSEYDISLLEEIARNIRNVRPFCSEVSALEDLIKNIKTL